MAIEKKSLIRTLKTTKKANVAAGESKAGKKSPAQLGLGKKFKGAVTAGTINAKATIIS